MPPPEWVQHRSAGEAGGRGGHYTGVVHFVNIGGAMTFVCECMALFADARPLRKGFQPPPCPPTLLHPAPVPAPALARCACPRCRPPGSVHQGLLPWHRHARRAAAHGTRASSWRACGCSARPPRRWAWRRAPSRRLQRGCMWAVRFGGVLERGAATCQRMRPRPLTG